MVIVFLDVFWNHFDHLIFFHAPFANFSNHNSGRPKFMGALSSMMGGKSEDQWKEEQAKKQQYARELG